MDEVFIFRVGNMGTLHKNNLVKLDINMDNVLVQEVGLEGVCTGFV